MDSADQGLHGRRWFHGRRRLCAGSQVSGQDLLTAIVIGYEIARRAGLAVHSLYAPVYHTSIVGVAAQRRPDANCGLFRLRIDAVLGMAEYYADLADDPMYRKPFALKDGAAAAWSAGMALQDVSARAERTAFALQPSRRDALRWTH